MENSPDKIGNFQSTAFILYRPRNRTSKAKLFFNKEAWEIIITYDTSRQKTGAASSELTSLCSSWSELLKKKLKGIKGENGKEKGTVSIDMLMSGNRRYVVNGTCVTSCDVQKEKQYIFVLERLNHDKVNFSSIVRKWKLNKREQDIVKLLLEGRSNKEIADVLNLSIHTVKSYLKLLSRKVGINARTGFIALLVSEIFD